MTYIVQSKVRALVNGQDKRISGEAMGVLDKRVEQIILNACTLIPKHVKTIKAGEMTQAKG
jgi:hypothetical protein